MTVGVRMLVFAFCSAVFVCELFGGTSEQFAWIGLKLPNLKKKYCWVLEVG